MNCFFVLFFLALSIIAPSAKAEDLSTCWIEESDCPAGPIDGLRYAPENTPVKDKTGWSKSDKLTCKYNNSDGTVDWINIRYRCYADEKAAQEAAGKYAPHEVVGDCEKDRYTDPGRCIGQVVIGRYLASISVKAHEEGDFSTNIDQNAHDDKLGAARVAATKAVAATFDPKGKETVERSSPEKDSSKMTVTGRAYALDILELDNPIPYAKIELEIDGETYSTFTDNDGKYSFDIDSNESKGEITLSLSAYSDNTKIFEVIDESDSVDEVKIWRSIDIEEDTDFVIDVALERAYEATTARAHVRALVDHYYQLSQAFDFSRFLLLADVTKLKGESILPISLYAFSRGADSLNSTFYDKNQGDISLSTKDSSYTSLDSPLAIFHEFGHHIMYSQYTPEIWDTELESGMSKNHGGIINTNTADSVGEGYATFLAILMAREYEYTYPHVYEPSPVAFGKNWEVNYKAWDMDGVLSREEFAVVTLFLDLLDSHRDKGDDVQMGLAELWAIIKDSKNQTVKDLYDSLILVEEQAKIDALFVEHGFFWDKQEGNRSFDEKASYTSSSGKTCKVTGIEPGLDTNKDGVIATDTEAWMDYSNWHKYPCEPTFDEGDVPGYTGSYQTRERKTFAHLPNRYMEVDNGTYDLKFSFPENPEYDYTLTYEVVNNRLPVDFPPARYDALLTVNDDLEISTDEYFQAIKDTYDKEVFRSEKRSGGVPLAVWIGLGATVVAAVAIKRKMKK